MAEPEEKDRKAAAAVENAEKKLQSLMEKRDAMNALASAAREERDMLNKAKQERIERFTAGKAARDKVVALLREHRSRRNALQAKAKALLGQKKKRAEGIYPDLPTAVEELKVEIKMLEMKQQTTTLGIEEERKVVELIRRRTRELAAKEKELAQQDTVAAEVSKMSGAVDELFRQADEEHREVVRISAQADELQAAIRKLLEELPHLHSEANKKHKLFLEYREKADGFHLKSVEMREKLMAMKKERTSDMREARAIIKEHNIAVRKTLTDSAAVEKKREEDLQELLKRGKIRL